MFNIIQLVLIDVKCPAESLKENELEEMRSLNVLALVYALLLVTKVPKLVEYIITQYVIL